MRWFWQRRAGEGTGVQAAAPSPRDAAPPAARADVSAARTVSAPLRPAGWAFLPPLQRTIATAPPVTRRHEPAAWWNPSFTGTMAHAVTAHAPAGVIDGDGGGLGSLGVPAERAPGIGLPLLLPRPAPTPTVQRSALPTAVVVPATPAAATRPLTSAPDAPMPLARPAVVAEPPADPAPMAAAVDVSVDAPAPAPVVASAPAPVVASATEQPPAPLLSGGFVDNGGATYVELPRPGAPADAYPSTAGGLPVARRGAPGDPASRASGADADPPVPAVQRSAERDAPILAAQPDAAQPSGTAPAAAPVRPASRRLGLGAPLNGAPLNDGDARPVQRAAEPMTLAPAASAPGAATAPRPAADLAPRLDGGQDRGSAEPPGAAGPGTSGSPDAEAPSAAAVQAEAPSTPPTLPMPVAQRVAEPVRDADSPPPAPSDVPGTAPAAESPAGSQPAAPAPAARADAQQAAAPTVQRAVEAPLLAERDRASAAAEPPTGVPVQRAAGGPLALAASDARSRSAEKSPGALTSPGEMAGTSPADPPSDSPSHQSSLTHSAPPSRSSSAAPTDSSAEPMAAADAPLLGTTPPPAVPDPQSSRAAVPVDPPASAAARELALRTPLVIQREVGLLGSRPLTARAAETDAPAQAPGAGRGGAGTGSRRPGPSGAPRVAGAAAGTAGTGPLLGTPQRPARAELLPPVVDLPAPAHEHVATAAVQRSVTDRPPNHDATAPPRAAGGTSAVHSAGRSVLPVQRSAVTGHAVSAASDAHAYTAAPSGWSDRPAPATTEHVLPSRPQPPAGRTQSFAVDEPFGEAVPVEPVDAAGHGATTLVLQRATDTAVEAPAVQRQGWRPGRLPGLGQHRRRQARSSVPAEAPEPQVAEPEPQVAAAPEPPAAPEPQPAAAPDEPVRAALDVDRLNASELDLLAGRLMEPITRRIKAELVIERERRGLRSDPR